MKRVLGAAVLVAGLLSGTAASATTTTTPSRTSATSPSRTTPTAGQQRQQQIATQIVTLRSQVADASAEEGRLLDLLDASDARLRDLSTKIAAIDGRIVPAQQQLDVAQGRLDGIEAHYLATSAQLEATQHQLDTATDDLRQRAVDAYVGGPEATAYADLVFHLDDVRALAASTVYLKAVLDGRARIVHQYRVLQGRTTGLVAALDGQRADALQERNVVAGTESALEIARRSQDGLRQQALAEQNQRQSLIAQVRGKKAEFQSQIRSLQTESASIARLLRSRQAGQRVQPSGHGVLSSPIPGAAVTSGFGPRVHPIFETVRMHTGIDLAAGMGDPIHAAANGVVVFAGPRGGYGLATLIDHGGSLATLYAHQSQILVSAGQHVVRGQVIGLVGATGYATGPHLHFEVRVNGTPVDPMPYL